MELIDLKKQYERIKPVLQERMDAVLQHGQFIMGPEIKELEKQLASYSGCRYCISCASGTDALLLSLMAYKIGPGDAVFTTPFTFIATAEVTCLLGATPVFVDIDPKTFNIDPAALKDAINHVLEGKFAPGVQGDLRPRGIIAVDLFGLPADYNAINQIAKENDLFVLEDAAQSFGGIYKDKKACNLADVAATSFFPAKPLGCYGDGGAVLMDNEELAECVGSLRLHGKGTHKYDNVRIGINGRLDTLQAAVLLAKLQIFDDEIERRQKVAARYTQDLKEVVAVPNIPEDCQSAWAQYSVLSSDREGLMKRLKDAGVPTAIYYPKPLHLQTAFSFLGYQEGDFPVSENISAQIFSLPMHPYLTDEDQKKVIEAIIGG